LGGCGRSPDRATAGTVRRPARASLPRFIEMIPTCLLATNLMPTLETLTESDLRGPLNAKSLRRARRYVRRVRNPTRSGHTLTAQVRGTRLYKVEIDVEPDGIRALCSCPYNWGGYCKHIGALLLKWIQSPGSFALEPAPAAPGKYPIEVIPVEPPPTYRPENPPGWIATTFAQKRTAELERLQSWLNEISIRDLRQIAKRRGWKAEGTRKAKVVRQIIEHLTDPEETLEASLALDDEHRRVLRALALLGENDRIQPEKLENVARVWGELKSYQNASTYTRHLREVGLALPGNVTGGSPPQSNFIPDAILRALPPVLKDVIPTSSHPQSSIGELHLADPRPFIRTVNQVALLLEQSPTPLRPPMPRPKMEKFYRGLKEWDYDPDDLQQAKAKGSLDGYSDYPLIVPPPSPSLPDEAIEQLTPVVGGEAGAAPYFDREERLEFIYSLLVAVGILQPGSPVTIWSETKERFLRQGELAQRAILARVYFGMWNWSVLWDILRTDDSLQLKRIPGYGHSKPEDLYTDLARFRHVVLRALASLPNGEWVALEDLSRLMRIAWPRFDSSVWQRRWHSSLDPSWFLFSTKEERPLRPMEANDWELAQGRFMRRIIAGPLHWLGLADLCFEEADEQRTGRLTAVRFHGLADLYWNRVETPDAPQVAAAQTQAAPGAADAVIVDGYTISVAPSAIPAQAHELFNKIARLKTAAAERFVYHLDSQTIHESFEKGASLTELLNHWEQSAPIPMPEAIREQLTAWWEAYGRVRIYEGLTVIEFGDDYALREMKTVTQIEKAIVAEISPRLVIVRPEAAASLVEELEKSGYTPKQTDEV